MWKSRTPQTASRRGRRLPAAIALLVMLALGVISWNARGRDPRPPRPAVRSLPAESGGFLEGTVVGIADGDTLTVLDDSKRTYKIRLLGIDAPENAQPFAKVAKQVLSDRVFEKRVRVQVKGQDRYGRSLGKVLRDGVDINLELLKEGLVWHYKHYAYSQFPGDPERYARAQASARSARLGLWAYQDPVEPWNWRQAQRRSSRRGLSPSEPGVPAPGAPPPPGGHR